MRGVGVRGMIGLSVTIWRARPPHICRVAPWLSTMDSVTFRPPRRTSPGLERVELGRGDRVGDLFGIEALRPLEGVGIDMHGW